MQKRIKVKASVRKGKPVKAYTRTVSGSAKLNPSTKGRTRSGAEIKALKNDNIKSTLASDFEGAKVLRKTKEGVYVKDSGKHWFISKLNGSYRYAKPSEALGKKNPSTKGRLR